MKPFFKLKIHLLDFCWAFQSQPVAWRLQRNLISETYKCEFLGATSQFFCLFVCLFFQLASVNTSVWGMYVYYIKVTFDFLH